MLKITQQKQQRKYQLGFKDEAAHAVLRDAQHLGYDSIELRRDGKRPIFVCLLCHTRCYNDASLWDHLKGSLHARHLAGNGFLKAEKQTSDQSSIVNVQKRNLYGAIKEEQSRMQLDVVSSRALVRNRMLPLIVLPELHLKLIDQGQMFVKVRPCSGAQFVEACWLEKRVLVQQQKQGGEAVYGLLVFPYSEGLGKGGAFPKNENVLATVDQAQPQQTKGIRGRKRAKQTERVCFICRQKMVAGKDVATLLNVSNRKMVCHSRNWLGAFHVYHTHCLIDWILIFDAKFWMGHSLIFSRNYRKSLMNVGQLSTQLQENPIFCPECQGTGFKFSSGHLEPPRYRLAQIFDWVLELVQARKVWVDHLGQDITGLMFHASKGICHPRDFESSLVLPRGTLQFFFVESDRKLDEMQTGSDGTASMEIDI